MEPSRLTLEIAVDHVAVVTLDNPPVNALGQTLRQDLVRVFDLLHDRDDVRAIVLTGRGKTFCAGADIREKRAVGPEPGAHRDANRLVRNTFQSVLECGKPVIAAVNGAAIGAGMVLATCCDFALAADHAVFAMPEIDVGLAGGAAFLRRVLPMPTIRRLLLTGERIAAGEMHRLGAVEECLAAERLMPRALELARCIAAKSPLAARAIKHAFGVVENLSPRDGFWVEQEMTAALSRTDDSREAQAAFLEKRAPVFLGR
jgi:enoyl-CoA hydratase